MGPGHFSRTSLAKSARSVGVFLVGSMVAASGTVFSPLVVFRAEQYGHGPFPGLLGVRAAGALLSVTGTPVAECGAGRRSRPANNRPAYSGTCRPVVGWNFLFPQTTCRLSFEIPPEIGVKERPGLNLFETLDVNWKCRLVIQVCRKWVQYHFLHNHVEKSFLTLLKVTFKHYSSSGFLDRVVRFPK